MRGEKSRTLPLLERTLRSGVIEAGVDEAGRGCLAGPVVAAAVILPPDFDITGLDDSKKLTARRRAELRLSIEAGAEWSVGIASPEEIDRINILQASLLAMRRAIEGLHTSPQHIAVDGNRWQPADIEATTVVGGDARLANIAAASILAKTHRDALMQLLAQIYPHYGWNVNMGYPTAAHRKALLDFGPSPLHRRSFRGVRPQLPGLEW